MPDDPSAGLPLLLTGLRRTPHCQTPLRRTGFRRTADPTKIVDLFSISRRKFRSFFSLGVFFVELWPWVKAKAIQSARFGSLGSFCETPAAWEWRLDVLVHALLLCRGLCARMSPPRSRSPCREFRRNQLTHWEAMSAMFCWLKG